MRIETPKDTRNRSFGQDWEPTPVDRCGTWLSMRRVRRTVGRFAGLDVADVGCGYYASLARTLLDEVRTLVLVDVSVDPALRSQRAVRVLEGPLPDVLAELDERSLDVVICNSVLEHLWDPERTVDHIHRVLRPGGVALINVPSWRGKGVLEFAAFRLGVSPPDEMNDHKRYFDPRDLWPLLVRAGFQPSGIRCFKHKFGLNTFAVCRRSPR